MTAENAVLQSTEEWAQIPTWQINELQTLSSNGELDGVDPHYLAAIDQAESSGEVNGAGVNSSGYGGYFGLGADTNYPGGSIPSSEMTQNNQQSFDDQAVVASSEFASLLTSNNGDAYSAESVYQGGGNEGTGIFSNLNLPQQTSGYTPTATTAGFIPPQGIAITPQGGAIAKQAGGAVLGALGLSPSSVGGQIIKVAGYVLGVGAGVVLVILGIYKFANPGKSIKQLPAQAEHTAGDAAKVAAVAAA